jgi:hypothetical protein
MDIRNHKKRGHCSVQVKSTYFQAGNLKPGNFVASLFHVGCPNHRYEQSDFDFLAVYCIPRDIWYIIPSESRPQARHPRLPRTNSTSGKSIARPGISSANPSPYPHRDCGQGSISTGPSSRNRNRAGCPILTSRFLRR